MQNMKRSYITLYLLRHLPKDCNRKKMHYLNDKRTYCLLYKIGRYIHITLIGELCIFDSINTSRRDAYENSFCWCMV